MPEVLLHVAEEPYGPWEATEVRSGVPGAPPPFWAFPWAGGVGLARHVLDAPEVVAGRRVVDLGCGSGLVGLAALHAGAAHVLAVDLDPLALAATRLNADLNGVPPRSLDVLRADVLDLARAADHPPADAPAGLAGAAPADADGPPVVPGAVVLGELLAADVVLVGDLFFERSLAAATLTVVRRVHGAGCDVLVGDPGRAHLPAGVFTEVAAYDVPVPAALEDAPVRRTRVLRLL